MDRNSNEERRPRIINMQGGTYNENVELLVQHNNYGNHGSNHAVNKPLFNLSDSEMMREVLAPVVERIKTSRQWFPLYRILVDGRYIEKGDYEDFATKMQLIFGDQLPKPIDVKDLSRLEVLSFALPFNKWTIDNAPVKGNTYHQYAKIGEFSRSIFCIEYDD